MYAKQLEAAGQTQDALKHFELSGTHRTEVPRMLFAQERLAELEVLLARGRARRRRGAVGDAS